MIPEQFSDEQLDAYLSDNLDPETRSALEQRMQSDPELAARVALEKGIRHALDEHSAENLFRGQLKAVEAMFPDPESLTSRTTSRKRWLLPSTLLVALAVAGYFYTQDTPPASPTPQGPEMPKEAPNAVPMETPAQQPEKQPVPAEPIAAAYRPLPALEKAIGSRMRNGDFSISVSQPTGNATVKPNASLTFKGKAEGRLPDEATFNLLIFSNDQTAFEAMQPRIKRTIDLSASGSFAITIKTDLKPGKYYWLIENELNGEWMAVQTFQVK